MMPTCTTVHVDFKVSLLATGWQTALDRAPTINSAHAPVELAIPEVASIHLAPCRVDTSSFSFSDTVSTRAIVLPDSMRPEIPRTGDWRLTSRQRPSGTVTRVRPPRDVIKLKDRLFYTLQPPLESIFTSGSLTFPCEPFPFQLEGVAFLYPRQAAMLADEMGLGKTMQAITTIRLLIYSGEIQSVLLICPKPLVTNWQHEFSQWAPELPITTIEGKGPRRQWLWKMPGQPVKIANYELLVRDEQLIREASVSFDLVVLDEAQRIKNRTSATSRSVRSVRRRRNWALTGTPIENSSEDLCSIFEFLCPGVLRSDLKPRRLRQATRDYLLRRTKDQVLDDLPPILCRDADLTLSSAQRDAYSLAEKEGVVRLAGMGGKITVQHVFELILRLKQICNFDPSTGCSRKYERLAADLEEVAASGAKAIVFSQWVKTLKKLKAKLNPYRPLEYHGQVPSARRDQIIEEFRRNPTRHVLLMSYGAGGVGLNLQFASYVFLFDRWWNPAVEDQAINRAHRIGADGPVTVTRFLTLGTIEERIDEVLRQKRELFQTVLADCAAPRNLGLSQQEIFSLFELSVPSNRLAA